MDNYIYGIRPVLEALKANVNIDKILVKTNFAGIQVKDIFSIAREQNISIQYVPIEKINKICDKNHQGIIAFISPVAYSNLETIITNAVEAKKQILILILENITDVRNFGAISRVCECAGVDAIVIPANNSVRITEDAIKASAGAMYNIPICRENNIIDAILMLTQFNINVYAITEKANENIYTADFNQNLALVVGAENIGISNQIMKRVNKKYYIPMKGKTESLNVSIASAIAVYEVLRQREMKLK